MNEFENFSKIWKPGCFEAVSRWNRSVPQNALFSGIKGSADALLCTELFHSSQKSLLVLVENTKRAEILATEITTFLGDDTVCLVPSRDAVPYNMKSPFGPTIEARFFAARSLLDGNKGIYVAPHAALMQKFPSKRELFNRIIRLEAGQEISIQSLAEWFTESGFRRENQVTDIGTFSIRGGIVDIYPFLVENPIRMEFWGDTIESIREFDVFTQKSLETKSSIQIFPMREFNFTADRIEHALDKMRTFCEENTIDQGGVVKLEHQWKSTGDLEGIEWFLHWFEMSHVSVLDYIPADSIVVWDDFVPVKRRLDETRQNYTRHLERVPDIFKPLVSPPEKLILSDKDIEDALELFTSVYVETLDTPRDTEIFRLDIEEEPRLESSLDKILENIESHYRDQIRCVIIAESLGHAERLQELLGEKGAFIEIALGNLQTGFIIRDTQRVLIYSETKLFNRPQHLVTRAKKSKNIIPLSGFEALTPGDFVVHEDHGIARFVGIERITTQEMSKDCMVLNYAEGARVYVPVDDFHKVQKYIGKESIAPTLSKIGTSSWDKLKEKTRESLKEMAQELIDLYAKRQFLEGIMFAPDNMWQKEFEDSFIYEETPDQLRAIQDVKKDMESKNPMDRLVCGDVGFGKTEVAMRAAFKAVMSGYQVAILAPTTILAAQHFSTFSERMSNFPVKVAMLSRFLKPSEQKPIVEKVQHGGVDIVIGTHRLLSQDIVFKNLGLVIIDEEQRFGVKHKEQLKQFRYKVDVLSLSATPIPRTLHMSLVGARDLSIINTPPRNRLPIDTKVAEYHDELVKRAIENELDRGGQVYFVNNRIKNLEQLQDKIEQLVPRAKVISAHGQMDEKLLEIIMKEFIAGRYDVLLSTVIIENGLDIPNVNTIVVNRADTLGLSQLYQLRGRVGRSSEQAYAYLLTLPFSQVSEDSLKRLRVLEQFTELGSGFQIAMRDLEIRGAGNILGTRQHGFIAAVGFELYCRLLQEAVQEIQGGKPAEPAFETKVEVSLQAYIPTEYISDGASRVAIYHEMSSLVGVESLADFEQSLSDRYGPMPPSVNALIILMKIKLLAQKVRINKVSINKESDLIFTFEGENTSVQSRVKNILGATDRQFTISAETPVTMRTKLTTVSTLEKAIESIEILTEVNGKVKE